MIYEEFQQAEDIKRAKQVQEAERIGAKAYNDGLWNAVKWNPFKWPIYLMYKRS
jgi:hypothetical protein